MAKKYGVITSSQNPEEIATKVKGVTLALSSIIVFLVGRFLHVQLTPSDIMALATSFGAIAGGIWAIYGAGLHILALLFENK